MNEELHAALEPAEQVLWEGRPQQGLMLRPSDRGRTLFTLVVLGMVVYGVIEHGLGQDESHGSVVFAWGFLAIGLYLAADRFVTDRFARARTVYAVTNRRIMIIGGLLERTVHTIDLPGLDEIALTRGKEGRGTLTFDRAAVGTVATAAVRVPSLAFEGIDNVGGVLGVIRAAQSDRASPDRGAAAVPSASE